MRDRSRTVITRTAPIQLWTIHEASQYLGVPVSTLYYWSYRGEGGPPILRVGRLLRYDAEQVAHWARSQVA